MVKELYSKYRIFIIPAVVGLICVCVVFFVIIPQIRELFTEKDQIEALASRTELLNKKTTELESLDEASLQQDLVTALTVLPTGQDVPQAMAVLQDLIARSNLALKSTSYSTASKNSGQTSFQLTVSLVGSVAATRDFLNNLREGSRIFKVESISLRLQPESSFSSVEIPLTVFYQPAPTTVLTLDQPVAKIDDKGKELIRNLSAYSSQKSAESTASAISIGKADPFE